MITNETLRTIKQRRSNRSFRAEQIKAEELQAVLEAGIYAPNATNQAWHFTVIQNREQLNRLKTAAKEAARQLDIPGIRELAKDEGFDPFYGAPTLILVSGDEQAPPMQADCAAATENMLLAAESMGLGSCWIYFVMFAFNSPQGPGLRKELDIPAGYKPFHSLVLGYKKDTDVYIADRNRDVITYIR